MTIDVQFGSRSDETKLSITTDGVTSSKRAWKSTAGSWQVYDGGALGTREYQ